MLYHIGTLSELHSIETILPRSLAAELRRSISALGDAYSSERNFPECGGYALLAETAADLEQVRASVDFNTRPCEWAHRLAGNYLAALFVINNDFTIEVFMPAAIAPQSVIDAII